MVPVSWAGLDVGHGVGRHLEGQDADAGARRVVVAVSPGCRAGWLPTARMNTFWYR